MLLPAPILLQAVAAIDGTNSSPDLLNLQLRHLRQNVGLYGVRRDQGLERLAQHAQLESNGGVAAVQHHHRHLPVRAHGRSGLQAVLASASAIRSGHTTEDSGAMDLGQDSGGARQYELGEMAYEVVLGVHVQRLPRFVRHYGSVAEVVQVVGPTTSIQEQVPVDPATSSGVEIADDVVRVALAEAPVLRGLAGAGLPSALLVGGLRWKQQGLRIVPMDRSNIVKLVARVPVEGHAMDVLPCDGMLVPHLCKVIHSVFVVVVHEDGHIRVLLLHGGTQELTKELGLLLGREGAGLPRRGEARLVLHGDGPDRNAMRLVG
mmetsp:Transcript_22538/g.63984  ORF Transcript_22538/g.63984 Transcript_22538/m.63984 type:complete len:319 (-) Transcript_22538:1190-2146(-)